MRERGLKLNNRLLSLRHLPVAPVRERGLKLLPVLAPHFRKFGRSREGAWIEILQRHSGNGLKLGRSREGAWIEIAASLPAGAGG